MNYDQLASFYERLGMPAVTGPDGVWFRTREGFVVRMPYHSLGEPSPEQAAELFTRFGALALRYCLPAGERGREGALAMLRDGAYGPNRLSRPQAIRLERGLERCQVRQVGFDDLHALGLPLNTDTLARQGQPDPHFTVPALWQRFCQAAAQTPGAQAWGAFAGPQLEAWAFVFRVDDVACLMYQMSRDDPGRAEAETVLDFCLAQALLAERGINALSLGPVGLQRPAEVPGDPREMGFEFEPVSYAVRLRPVLRAALLNGPARGSLALLRRGLPRSRIIERVHNMVDIAAAS
jgi:hypothetical protein